MAESLSAWKQTKKSIVDYMGAWMSSYMLKIQTWLPVFAIALTLVGCSGMPKNAEEFRQGAINSPFRGTFNLVETYEVSRPFRDVTVTLQKKAKECLSLSYDWSSEYGQYRNKRSGTTTYKPTFIANPNRTELHLQYKSTGTIQVGAPADGAYLVVLDATPIAKDRTRIETYASSNVKLIRTAMRGWATGDNLGCPDLMNK